MKRMLVLISRVAGLFWKEQRDRELAEEIESNLQFHIADNLRAGMNAEEARRQALIAMGGMEAMKEAYREQRGLPFLDVLFQDIRYAMRGLRRSPGFAVTAVLTLALGVGATAGIFSAAYALLIRPLPYRDPSRLVWVAEHTRDGSSAIMEPDMVAWRERGRPFESVAGYAFDEYTLSGIGDNLRVSGAMVSANFLSVLGVAPQLGRDFTAADDHSNSPLVALLSDELWRERFNSDPRTIGRTVHLDQVHACTVVGVLPRPFRFPDMTAAPQIMLPLRAPGSSVFNLDQLQGVRVIARMPRGQTLASAAAELQVVQQARLRAYPPPLARVMEESALEVASLQRHLAGDSRTPLLILLVGVGLVLLISCANIANLQLVRAAARHHEIAVRGALGAARSRLARQFLTESMVIGALAACVGLVIGAAIVDAIRGWQSPRLPWLSSVSLDPYMFAFTLAVAVLAAVSCGAAPAISGSRANLLDALKATSLRMSRGCGHRLLRNAFIVGEVALALVVLIAAGLLLRSFRDLMRVDPGYDPRNVLTAKVRFVPPDITPATAKTGNYPRLVAFASEVLAKARALPGVRYAAVSQVLPLEDYRAFTAVWFGPTPPPPAVSLESSVPLISISPDSFRAMGTTIIAGRAFTEDDNENALGVAIVNQAFVRKFIGGEALGRWFHSMYAAEHCANCSWNEPAELQIVGIAEDVRQHGLEQPVEPEVYLPFAQAAKVAFNIVIATTGNPAGLAPALRTIIRSVNREVPVFEVSTLEQRLSGSLAQRRLTMFLLSAFAVLALLLAAVGVYGVISYSVVRRTQEIGIRIAMGATRGSVLRLILGQQARMILLGNAIGLALAVALSGAMRGLLYGVSPWDIATFALSCLVLTAVAFLASAAPAMRAARTDPSVAIRYE